MTDVRVAVWPRDDFGQLKQAPGHMEFVLCNIRIAHHWLDLVVTAINRRISHKCGCSKNGKRRLELGQVTKQPALSGVIHLVKLTTRPMGISSSNHSPGSPGRQVDGQLFGVDQNCCPGVPRRERRRSRINFTASDARKAEA